MEAVPIATLRPNLGSLVAAMARRAQPLLAALLADLAAADAHLSSQVRCALASPLAA
jgi:hypothetical protein